MGIFGNHEGMHRGEDGDWYPDKPGCCGGGAVKTDTKNIEMLLIRVVKELGRVNNQLQELNNRIEQLEGDSDGEK